MITAVVLMATLPADTWIRLVVWMVIGLVDLFRRTVRTTACLARQALHEIDVHGPPLDGA